MVTICNWQVDILPDRTRRQECQPLMSCKKSNPRTGWSSTRRVRMSVSNRLQEIKSTYLLIQRKKDKNIFPWTATNQNYVLSDPAQAQQECRSPMGCKKSNPRTTWSSTSMARMSVSNGLQEIKSTYKLNQHKQGKNVNLQICCKKSNPRTPW